MIIQYERRFGCKYHLTCLRTLDNNTVIMYARQS